MTRLIAATFAIAAIVLCHASAVQAQPGKNFKGGGVPGKDFRSSKMLPFMMPNAKSSAMKSIDGGGVPGRSTNMSKPAAMKSVDGAGVPGVASPALKKVDGGGVPGVTNPTTQAVAPSGRKGAVGPCD